MAIFHPGNRTVVPIFTKEINVEVLLSGTKLVALIVNSEIENVKLSVDVALIINVFNTKSHLSRSRLHQFHENF